jgi:predicted RND superfamily exporter protein
MMSKPAFLQKIMSGLYDRTIRSRPRLVLAVAVALLLVSLAALPFFRVDASLQVRLPDGPGWAELAELGERFAGSQSILVMVDGADPADAFGRMRQVSARLERESAHWTVDSAANARTLKLFGDELATVPLAPDLETAEANLAASPVLRSLLKSRDGGAWLIWLSLRPEADGGTWLPVLESVKRDFPGVLVGGTPYLTAHYQEVLPFNLYGLLAVAAAVLFLVYLALLRSPLAAACLWTASIVPTVLLLGLYVATGTRMQVYTVLAPFLTLALSTSYNMHLFYGWLLYGRDLRAAYLSRGPVLLVDALVALIGFATLFMSPFAELRLLGAFVLSGIVVALVFGMLPFAAFLELAGRRRWLPRIQSLPGGKAPDAAGGRARRPWFALALVVALFAAGAAGMTRLGSGMDWTDQILPWGTEADELHRIERACGGVDQIVVEIDTKAEYGLTSLETFRRIQAVQAGALSVPGVTGTFAYTDAVGEVLSHFPDGGGPGREPRSDADIAEAMELLAGAGGTPGLAALQDSAWRRAYVVVRLAESQGRAPVVDIANRLGAILDGQFAGAWRPGGYVLLYARLDTLFVHDQTIALAILGVAYLVLLGLGFRSVKKAALAVGIPFAALAFVLGLCGFAGWRLNGINAVSLVMIVGISIDSAIMCLMVPSNPATRRAIRDTMVVLSAVILVLAGASFYTIFQTAVLACVGLLVTLFIVLGVLDPWRRGGG